MDMHTFYNHIDQNEPRVSWCRRNEIIQDMTVLVWNCTQVDRRWHYQPELDSPEFGSCELQAVLNERSNETRNPCDSLEQSPEKKG